MGVTQVSSCGEVWKMQSSPNSQQVCSAALTPKYLPPQYPLMALSSLIKGSPHLLMVPLKVSLEPLSPSLPWSCSALTLPPAWTFLKQVLSLWDEPLLNDAHFNLFPGWVLTLVLGESWGSCCRLVCNPGSVSFPFLEFLDHASPGWDC